jgi:DNA-directed RNA polymerase specialized sigma24 family protein
MLVHTTSYMRDSFFEGARMQHHVDTAQGSFGGSLYHRFATTIFTYLSQQVPNEQDAEDLLLEVFLAALKNDSLSTMSAPSQLAWLRRVLSRGSMLPKITGKV